MATLATDIPEPEAFWNAVRETIDVLLVHARACRQPAWAAKIATIAAALDSAARVDTSDGVKAHVTFIEVAVKIRGPVLRRSLIHDLETVDAVRRVMLRFGFVGILGVRATERAIATAKSPWVPEYREAVAVSLNYCGASYGRIGTRSIRLACRLLRARSDPLSMMQGLQAVTNLDVRPKRVVDAVARCARSRDESVRVTAVRLLQKWGR